MNQELLNRNIVLPSASFIAYLFFTLEGEVIELNVIFRKGKQYRYRVTETKMKNILKAQNRSNYISQTVIHNKRIKAEFVQFVPLATVESITRVPALNKFLAK